MSSMSYILCIPEIALEKIFSFLTYDEIAKNRIVCKTFNDIGSKLLSRSFHQLEKRHAAMYKKFKSLLPRRESERRSHPLSRQCDILQAVETRISMLNMTYNKYIQSNVLCFIPGKVLDEIKGVLRLVENDQNPPRTHQLLQELRDLSSMAMEHFEDHILPRIQQQVRSDLSYSTSTSVSKALVHNSLSNEINKVRKQSKTHKHYISYLTQSTQKLFQKVRKQNVRLKAQSLKIREQLSKIQQQDTKIQEQETALTEMKKRISEWDQKHKDLATELVRAKEDFMLFNSQGTSTEKSQKIYESNIKPYTNDLFFERYLRDLATKLVRAKEDFMSISSQSTSTEKTPVITPKHESNIKPCISDIFCEKYLQDLVTKLVRTKEDFISISSQSTSTEKSPRLYGGNIIPQNNQISTISYLELDRKRKGNSLNDVPVKQFKTENQDTKCKTPKKIEANLPKVSQILNSVILNQPLSMKFRKRKMQEDIDL